MNRETCNAEAPAGAEVIQFPEAPRSESNPLTELVDELLARMDETDRSLLALRDSLRRDL